MLRNFHRVYLSVS